MFQVIIILELLAGLGHICAAASAAEDGTEALVTPPVRKRTLLRHYTSSEHARANKAKQAGEESGERFDPFIGIERDLQIDSSMSMPNPTKLSFSMDTNRPTNRPTVTSCPLQCDEGEVCAFSWLDFVPRCYPRCSSFPNNEDVCSAGDTCVYSTFVCGTHDDVMNELCECTAFKPDTTGSFLCRYSECGTVGFTSLTTPAPSPSATSFYPTIRRVTDDPTTSPPTTSPTTPTPSPSVTSYPTLRKVTEDPTTSSPTTFADVVDGDCVNVELAIDAQNVDDISLSFSRWPGEVNSGWQDFILTASDGVMGSGEQLSNEETNVFAYCLTKGRYLFEILSGSPSFSFKIEGEEAVWGGYFGTPVELGYQIYLGYEPPYLPMDETDKKWLDSINKRRKIFHEENGASYRRMVWSPYFKELAGERSQGIVDSGCTFPPGSGDAGETISAMISGGQFEVDPEKVLATAYSDEDRKQLFTQMVWRSSRYVGCSSTVGAFLNKDGDQLYCHASVCKYARAGNCDVTEENWLNQTLADRTRCGPPCGGTQVDIDGYSYSSPVVSGCY